MNDEFLWREVAKDGIERLGLTFEEYMTERYFKAIALVEDSLVDFIDLGHGNFQAWCNSQSRPMLLFPVGVDTVKLIPDCICEDWSKEYEKQVKFNVETPIHWCKHALALMITVKEGQWTEKVWQPSTSPTPRE